MTDAETLTASIGEPMRDRVRELAENVLFLEAKLEETRGKAANMDLVIPYDNGGGQTGIRKNPVFEAYAQTFSQYRAGLSQLADMIEASGNVKPETKSKLAELRVLTGNLREAQ